MASIWGASAQSTTFGQFFWPRQRALGLVFIGPGWSGDLRLFPPNSQQAFCGAVRNHIRNGYPCPPNEPSMLWQFCHEAQPGDWVILKWGGDFVRRSECGLSTDPEIIVGQIRSPYFYRADLGCVDWWSLQHARKVEWYDASSDSHLRSLLSSVRQINRWRRIIKNQPLCAYMANLNVAQAGWVHIQPTQRFQNAWQQALISTPLPPSLQSPLPLAQQLRTYWTAYSLYNNFLWQLTAQQVTAGLVEPYLRHVGTVGQTTPSIRSIGRGTWSKVGYDFLLYQKAIGQHPSLLVTINRWNDSVEQRGLKEAIDCWQALKRQGRALSDWLLVTNGFYYAAYDVTSVPQGGSFPD